LYYYAPLILRKDVRATAKHGGCFGLRYSQSLSNLTNFAGGQKTFLSTPRIRHAYRVSTILSRRRRFRCAYFARRDFEAGNRDRPTIVSNHIVVSDDVQTVMPTDWTNRFGRHISRL
jgi:hypothetical protein